MERPHDLPGRRLRVLRVGVSERVRLRVMPYGTRVHVMPPEALRNTARRKVAALSA